MKYPRWFNYAVETFDICLDGINVADEINKELIKRDVDASDIINITYLEHINELVIFYKRRP